MAVVGDDGGHVPALLLGRGDWHLHDHLDVLLHGALLRDDLGDVEDLLLGHGLLDTAILHVLVMAVV
eukprot:8541547-Heterocapsa_arctica.AAC.1